MPIYEYQCSNCQHELEVLQKLSDLPLTDCPACHEPALKKRISAAGFRLKGQGWYETDFKKNNQKNLARGAKDQAASKPASDSKANSDKSKTASGTSSN